MENNRNTSRNFLRLMLTVLVCILTATAFTATINAEGTSAEETSAEEIAEVRYATSAEQGASYWNTYGIPTSAFTAVANGGYYAQPDELAKAFDRSLNTAWKSNFINYGKYTIDGVANTNWHNYIDITFTQNVTLDRVLYCAINDADGKGYPTTFRIWYDSDNEGEFELYNEYKSTNSTSMMCFELGGSIEVARVRLEWVDIPKYHYYNATAREIVFLQPEVEEIENMFADFTRTTLSEGYDSEKLTEIREALETNVNYESCFKPLIDRAQEILDGTVVFDSDRLFSTDWENDGGHELYQYGNRRSYAQNTLGMAWFGIDKQSLGISGKAGETITVYVDAPEGTPMPRINVAQYFGDWRGWQNEFSLQRGINTITIPAICVNYCTWPAQQQGGGTIYIENPYTAEQQGSDIKIYIEGGYSFPVYRLGESEEEYKAELTEYQAQFAEYGWKEESHYFLEGVGFNVTELENDHILITVEATNTYNVLYGGSTKLSVQTSMENWNTVMEKLLEYDGIPTSPESKYYSRWNDCNEHLGIQIRLAQPYGAAYGSYEAVGIFYDDWVSSAIYCDGKLGWGMIHEIGHTMDMSARIVSECSNNMYSKYFESVEFSNGTRGSFANDLAALTSDRIDHTASSYFNTNRLNFLVWFRLEAYHPGFWGEIANLYRYDCAGAAGLNATEKHIYLSSRVLGIDMRYYYERFGYAQSGSDTPFTIAGQSETLANAMQALIDSGEIRTDIQPKFWYYDSNQFALNFSGKLDGNVHYDGSEIMTIRSVEKTSSGYNLLISGADSTKNHLGYEIYEGSESAGWQVIGFTYGSSYLDASSYEEGYVPTYKVVAVDRNLCTSAASAPAQISTSSDICRIEGSDTTYASIAEAITAANAGDTIVILCDRIETGIVISKNLTIKGDEESEEPVVLSKGSSGILIKITSGANVTIDGAKLILDGNSFEQSGTLVYCEDGTLTLTGLELRNNLIASGSDSYGGAIRGIKGTINLNGCNIHDNSAQYGGGVALSAAKVTCNINGTSIHNNKATQNGGGIVNTGAIYIYNSSITDNTAPGGGGGIYVYSGGILCTNTDFNRSSVNTSSDSTVIISGNSARDGGGIYQDGNTKLYNVIIENNHATANGGGIYSAALSGSHRSVYTYSGTIIRYNTAVHTGSQVYSKCGSGAGPKLTDTVIIGTSTSGGNLTHIESGTAGVFTMTNTSVTIAEQKEEKVRLTEGKEFKATSIKLPFTDSELVWNSNNPEVASVDDNGKITAVAPGNATITVSNADSTESIVIAIKVTQVGEMLLDTNSDGKTTVSDAIYLMWSLFYPDEYSLPSSASCDYNGDGTVNTQDAVYLLWNVFYPEEYPI